MEIPTGVESGNKYNISEAVRISDIRAVRPWSSYDRYRRFGLTIGSQLQCKKLLSAVCRITPYMLQYLEYTSY